MKQAKGKDQNMRKKRGQTNQQQKMVFETAVKLCFSKVDSKNSYLVNVNAEKIPINLPRIKIIKKLSICCFDVSMCNVHPEWF